MERKPLIETETRRVADEKKSATRFLFLNLLEIFYLAKNLRRLGERGGLILMTAAISVAVCLFLIS